MSVSGGDGLERAASECALQCPPSWRISEGPSFLPFVLFLKATPAKDDYYRYTKMHHASERGNSYICASAAATTSSSSCAGFTSLCNVIHFRSHGQITIIIKIKTGGSSCAQPIVITKWRKSCAHNERIYETVDVCVCATIM